jgi:hypothetical protein
MGGGGERGERAVMANYRAVAEALRLAEQDTALLRQVMKMREGTMGLTAGARIRDNDPRMPNRVLQVTGFDGEYVFARFGPGFPDRMTRIRRDRVYTDGKPRRSGWSVVGEVGRGR